MLFHATTTHAPESCPLAQTGTRQDWSARANEAGITLISGVSSQPSHTQYFIVETDDVEKLQAFFRSGLGWSTADIRPVRDFVGM